MADHRFWRQFIIGSLTISRGLYHAWFVEGDGFNAKGGAEQLFRNFARSRKPDQVRAAVGMHSSIQLAVLTGFADVAHAWTKWNDRNPMFTYADSGVVGAIKVWRR